MNRAHDRCLLTDSMRIHIMWSQLHSHRNAAVGCLLYDICLDGCGFCFRDIIDMRYKKERFIRENRIDLSFYYQFLSTNSFALSYERSQAATRFFTASSLDLLFSFICSISRVHRLSIFPCCSFTSAIC